MPTVIVKQPGQDPERTEVESLNYKVMQGLVGGCFDLVRIPSPDGDERTLALYVNDEGLLIGLPPNIRHPHDPRGSILVGPIVVSCADEEGEEVPMSEGELDLVDLLLRELAFSQAEVTALSGLMSKGGAA